MQRQKNSLSYVGLLHDFSVGRLVYPMSSDGSGDALCELASISLLDFVLHVRSVNSFDHMWLNTCINALLLTLTKAQFSNHIIHLTNLNKSKNLLARVALFNVGLHKIEKHA